MVRKAVAPTAGCASKTVRGLSLFWKAIGKLAPLLTVLYIHLFEHLGLAPTVLPTDAGHEAQPRVLC